MAKEPKKKRVKVQVYLPEDRAEYVRGKAEIEDTSMSRIINRLVDADMKRG